MKKVFSLVVIFLSYSHKVMAIDNPASGFFVTPGGATTFRGLIDWAIATLLGLLGIVSIFFIIIGGYQYVFSGANEELAERGKKTLKNAIIGLVIAILSYVILKVVVTTLDGA